MTRWLLFVVFVVKATLTLNTVYGASQSGPRIPPLFNRQQQQQEQPANKIPPPPRGRQASQQPQQQLPVVEDVQPDPHFNGSQEDFLDVPLDQQEEYYGEILDNQLQPPLPPPPPVQEMHPLQRPLSTTTSTTQPEKRLPIHYQFRSKGMGPRTAEPPYTTETGEDNYNDDFVPMTSLTEDDVDNPYNPDEDSPSFASPRTDAVTRYLSNTSMGRYKLTMSSGLVGAAIGAFVGKSLFSSPTMIQRCILLWFVVFLLGTILRNPYGELVRAMGLALIYVIQETKIVRQRYPVGWQRFRWALVSFVRNQQQLQQLQQQLPISQRRQPFPNPRRPDEFSRVYALIAMALIGSICGSNIPIIPSWLGAMITAVGMAFGTTLTDARGDLARIMAMRVVALSRELWQIQQELEIVPKLGVVSGLLLDKVMILDRQHRIKEKLGSFLTLVYTQIARVVQQSQQQTRNDGGQSPTDSFGFGENRSSGRDGSPSQGNSQNDWRRPRRSDDENQRPDNRWDQQQQRPREAQRQRGWQSAETQPQPPLRQKTQQQRGRY